MAEEAADVARDPGDLYQMSSEALGPDSDLVMLYYLDGFVDAGAAGRQLATHLLGTLEHTEVARFDVDSLIDYRSRRPPMIFTKDHWESVEVPEIALHLLKDSAGTPFLLLNGLEPDREWETFSQAVLQMSDALKVRLAASFHGIPMGVPHTRPLGVTGTPLAPTLIDGYRPLVDRLQVPGSASALIEFRMGEACAGRRRVRRARAALPRPRLLPSGRASRCCSGRARHRPVPALRRAARGRAADRRWRSPGRSRARMRSPRWSGRWRNSTTLSPPSGQNLLAGEPENMPTADELGAQFERFLAEQQQLGGDGTESS